MGKKEKITITNDKGRLSQEEIERMVEEAEQYADEDKKVRERIEGRNSLESYVYSVKNTINDEEKLKGKISDEDREKVEEMKETNEWLDENQNAEKEEYEEKQKAMEKIVNPIFSKLYQESGGGDGGDAGGDDDEESHDEL